MAGSNPNAIFLKKKARVMRSGQCISEDEESYEVTFSIYVFVVLFLSLTIDYRQLI